MLFIFALKLFTEKICQPDPNVMHHAKKVVPVDFQGVRSEEGELQ